MSRAFLLSLLALGCSGCFDFRVDKEAGLDSFSSSELSYAKVRREVFAPRCLSCHGVSAKIGFDSYEQVKARLTDIERVALVEQTMPPRSPLNEKETRILKAWLDAGAPEGQEPAPDPTPEEPLEPRFKSIKRKIFETRCLSCHSAGGEAARIPLETWQDLLNSPLELVLPGNAEESGLMIAVTRTDDKRMPPPKSGFGRLSDDEIRTIERWIQEGAKP